ncbi:MAG: hypothetical protein JO270_00190 [Acidobacteriaceae bacterium]|nr:hypothetical protein [Acidobacteriaceae bacterium]
MPSKYTRPSAADLAKRMYGTFVAILHTDHSIEEDDWEHVPDDIKNAFIEAMDMTIKEEIEMIAEVFEREVDDVAKKKAQAIADQIISSSPPPPKPDGKPVPCYYCLRRPAVKWYACTECLKS